MSNASTETVIVRDRDAVRRLTDCEEWTTLTMLAALSDDPRSFDELTRAWLRYEPDAPLENLAWTPDLGDPPTGPWLLLDTACLRVVAGGGEELPASPAAFQRDEGDWGPGMPVVWINFPPDWNCVEGADWSDALPPLPVPVEPLDARGVLFGRPLAEGIARRVVDAVERGQTPADPPSEREWFQEDPRSDAQREADARWRELTIRIHADWLLTPHADLEGETPRCFLHRGREWIEREVFNRQQQWSQQGAAPRGLDRNTFAYRFGPLGRDEVVMYFDLCRELIAFAWRSLAASPAMDEPALAAALDAHARWWLTEGSIDGSPTSPAVIIETERRKTPLLADESHFDCDCPICRMQAELDLGPAFGGFDGYHLELDDEFAFSLTETRAEWGKEQQEQREFRERIDTEQKAGQVEGDDPLASVWKSSYVDEDSLATPGPLATMALAMRLAELISGLQECGAARKRIESINGAFDNYRRALEDGNSPDSDGLILASSTAELIEALEQVAVAHPQLTPKAADLQSLVAELSRNRESST
jgi:hypothetical protein